MFNNVKGRKGLNIMKKEVFILVIIIVLSNMWFHSAFAGSANVTAKQFGDEWPFTVPSGILSCEGKSGLGAVVFTTNGKSYAVNGAARQKAKREGYKEISEIWKDNPQYPGSKVNIGPIIQKGLTLCK